MDDGSKLVAGFFTFFIGIMLFVVITCQKDSGSTYRYSNSHSSGYSSTSSTSGYVSSGSSTTEKHYSSVSYDNSNEKPRCSKKYCNAYRTHDSRYCSDHTCQRGHTICKNEVSGANEKCSSCKKYGKKPADTSTYYKGGTSKSSTKYSSKKPDCDDYEDYDDFMDDWDGKMPDGSDAEDYWENW